MINAPVCCREWGIKVLDWHTQHSTKADSHGLISKLKRLMPIVGCEADAVAFEEEERRSLLALPVSPGEAKTVHYANDIQAGSECATGLA